MEDAIKEIIYAGGWTVLSTWFEWWFGMPLDQHLMHRMVDFKGDLPPAWNDHV